MENVDGIVEMLTNPTFIQRHWMQSPKVLSAHGLFESAVNVLPLRKWVEMYSRISVNSMEYIYAGEHKPIHKYDKIDLDNILESIQKVAEERTLILRDFQAFNKFYRAAIPPMAQKFQSEHKVGMFVSLNQTPGLGKHRDRYHIFVFQHSGSCFWKIHHFYDRRRIALKHTLVPGEILYIPPGCPHQVERLEKDEAHVSVGFHNGESLGEFYIMMLNNPLLSPVLDRFKGLRDHAQQCAAKELEARASNAKVS